MSSSAAAPTFVSSIPIEGPVLSLETVSFHKQTQDIMSDICRFAKLQNTREKGKTAFDFIAEAAVRFLNDPENGLEGTKQRFEAAAKLDETNPPEDDANHIEAEPLSASAGLSGCYSSLYYLALQIINAAIAQCLEAFHGADIQQSPRLERSEIPWNNTIEERAEFLRTLFTTVETQERLSKKDVGFPKVVQVCDNPSFRYKEQLRSSLGEVRVATITPGTADEPVQCQLSVRNLTKDGLHETLSYVWGSGPASHTISVDGKMFKVRDSLYLALKGLRRPDSAREVWIDALCINQADSEERTGQVKLMQRIYALSSKTTIWLGDDEPEVEEDFPDEAMDKPLRDWLDEPTVDENNLPSMLEFCRKLTANLAPGLKEQARGRLTGDEGDNAADVFQFFSRRTMHHNVSPISTFCWRGMSGFMAEQGLAVSLGQWFFGSVPEPPTLDGKTVLTTSDPDPKHLDGYLWAGKLIAAMVSLCRCVAVVLSHSWWERMWVIQESYLPRAPPDIYFRGSLFSWKDLEEALDVCKELIVATNTSYSFTPQEELDSLSGADFDKEDAKSFFHNSFAFTTQLENLESKTKLSFALRERKTVDDKLPHWESQSLLDTLEKTAPYRAGMPVDKVFALESLFNPVIGSLMDLNYNRPVSEVFRRTTLQAATNSADFACLVKRFDFLKDDKGQPGSTQPWPSWVFDFTFSDAEQRRVDDAVVEFPTFEGALFSAANVIGDGWTPEEYRASENIFFTPKVLYCSGICIPTGDDAFSIQLPEPSIYDEPQWYGFPNIFREDFKASRSPYLGEPYMDNPMLRHFLMGAPLPKFREPSIHGSGQFRYDLYGSDPDSSNDDESKLRRLAKPKAWRKVPPLLRPTRPSSLTPADTTDGSAVLEADRSVSRKLGKLWLRGLNELWSLGYNRVEGAVWSMTNPNRPPLVSLYARGKMCTGKHAIFLDTGLSALSCVAYEKGDVFAMLCGTGVFLHLRLVGRGSDNSQHRIVSRLLVAGTLEGEITPLFKEKGAYMRDFEIV